MIKKVKKGFTLIELVVVIAVIAILSAVSVVAYVGITNSAKRSTAEQDASKLKTLIRAELIRSDYVYKGTTTVEEEEVPFTYTFSYDTARDKVEYKLAEELDDSSFALCKLALGKFIIDVQGYTSEEAGEALYVYSDTARDDKDAVKKGNTALELKNPNWKEWVSVVGFEEKVE